MTITYRTAGDWGAGKGANLTPAEVDESFYSVELRLEALENYPPSPVEITNITVSGSQLTFHLSDSTTYGPFTLPRALPAATVKELDGTTYTISGDDDGKYLRATNAAGLAVTIPSDTAAIPVNAVYRFIQAGDATVTFAGTATINRRASRDAETAEKFAIVKLKKIAASVWDLTGELAETSV